MARASCIEWTESTWNPIVGCAKASAGCRNCCAERMAKRLVAMAQAERAAGRAPGRKANHLHVIDRRGQWSGDVLLNYSALEDPLRWRSPRVVFVNSMTHLFHEDLPPNFIRAVFSVMNRRPQHTFHMLTERPRIAAEYSGQLWWTENVWVGITAEDAPVTDRVHSLRHTGVRINFLSVRPPLGPIPRLPLSVSDWVIVGGQLGPGARPIGPEWVRQSRARGVAHDGSFFFKRWGGVAALLDDRRAPGRTGHQHQPADRNHVHTAGSSGDTSAPGTNKEHYLADSLNWRTGELIVTEGFPGEGRNAALFVRHPDDLCCRLRCYRKIHVIRDNARFHDCRWVWQHLGLWGRRVEPHFLPAYCPQANLIERIWWHLQEEITCNHRCHNLGELLYLVFTRLDHRRPLAIEDQKYNLKPAA